MIQSTPNVVKFVKSLGWDDESLLYSTIAMFLVGHGCEAPGCDSFSYLQCESCLSAHYCNVECQEKDWEKHKLKEGKEGMNSSRRFDKKNRVYNCQYGTQLY